MFHLTCGFTRVEYSIELLTHALVSDSRCRSLLMKSQALLVLLAASSTLAQGTFQNLGFESPTLPLVPNALDSSLPRTRLQDGPPTWERTAKIYCTIISTWEPRAWI